MQTPSGIAHSVMERMRALGVAETLAALSPRSTISPRTLELAGATLLAPLEGAPGGHVPTSTDALPRISVDSRLETADASLPVASTADLCVLGVLGEGGMGRVLEVRQASLGRDVAMKTLRVDDKAPNHVAALLREARLTGALEHPGIVPVHLLALDHEGAPLMIMKRIDGVSLQRLLDDASHPRWASVLSTGGDREEAALEILMQVCQSLAFAHDRGILHRDVKPENVMVGSYGEVYLVDWGVAATLEEANAADGMIVGTPAYMAPEMLAAQGMDARTDVYLLGATLHHVLTGRPRHDGTTMMHVIGSVALSDPIDYGESVPAMLADLCNRATSADPAKRPASALAFGRELAAYLRYRSAMALCETALERVEALEQALEAAGEGAAPRDIAGAYRMATEARFGFAESLRAHPSLEAAKAGLARTLRALFELELRQRHVDSAAAILEELPEPDPTLDARLSAMREEERARMRDEERRKEIERDHDPNIAVNSRQKTMGMMMIAAVGLSVVFLVRGDAGSLTPRGICVAGLFMVLAASISAAVAWPRMGTLFNRRIAMWLIATATFVEVHRVSGWLSGEGVATTLAGDTLLIAAMATVGTVLHDRRFGYIAGVVFGTHVGTRIFPAWSAWMFNGMAFVAAAVFIGTWWQTRKRRG